MKFTNHAWLSVLAALLFLPIRSDLSGQAEVDGSSLDLSGTWSDACSCSIPCPCWQTGRANVRHCLNVQVFHPDTSGSSNGKAVFVLIGSSEGYWAPSRYTLYLDDSTDPMFARKVGAVFKKYYGADLATSRGVAIRMEITPRTQRVDIPGILRYRIESHPNIDISDSVSNYLYNWLFEPEQWRTTSLRYRSETGQVIEYKGTSSLVARFRLHP